MFRTDFEGSPIRESSPAFVSASAGRNPLRFALNAFAGQLWPWRQAVLAWCVDLEGIASQFAGPLPDIGPVGPDPHEDHVIATAVAVNGGIIVPGDKDLLALG